MPYCAQLVLIESSFLEPWGKTLFSVGLDHTQNLQALGMVLLLQINIQSHLEALFHLRKILKLNGNGGFALKKLIQSLEMPVLSRKNFNGHWEYLFLLKKINQSLVSPL